MIIVSREILAEYSPFVWMGSYGFRANAASVAIEVGGGNQIGQFQVGFFCHWHLAASANPRYRLTQLRASSSAG